MPSEELGRIVQLYTVLHGVTATMAKPPSPKFTHFVALRIASPAVSRAVSAVHEALIEKDSELASCLVPTSKLHVTMGLMHVADAAQLARAKEVIEEAAKLAPARIPVSLPGLGSFGKEVLFAHVQETESRGALVELAKDVDAAITARGLRGVKQPAFRAHATIAKLSKWKAGKKKRRRPKIEADYFEALRATPLGGVVFTRLELLAMRGDACGYYPVVGEVPLGVSDKSVD